MDYQQLIDTMSPEIYQKLKRSLEVGKWPDGKPLTAGQRHQTMQAIIAWGENHLPENERSLIEAHPNDAGLLRSFLERMFEGKGTVRAVGTPEFRRN